MTRQLAADANAAWAEVLDNEHATIFGYEVIGGRLGEDNADVKRALDFHLAVRDDCIERIEAAGGTPNPPSTAYTTPPTQSLQQTRALAASLERVCQYTYGQLVAIDGSPTEIATARAKGSNWLHRSATMSWVWTGQIEALPGLA